MNEIQTRKIKWLSRAGQIEQRILSLRAAQKYDQYLLRELKSFEDCSSLLRHAEELQEEVKAQIIRLASAREDIRCVIEAIPDMEIQSIFTRKYLAYETNEQIAEALFYDVRTIQRKHKKALNLIYLPDENGISETTIFPNISCEN